MDRATTDQAPSAPAPDDGAPTDAPAADEVLPPVRRQIVVPTDPGRAFELWTEGIGDWWPLDVHGVYGAGATVAFVDGVLLETSPTGETSSWGEVLDWAPGDRVRITWHPGSDPERATEVAVSFEPVVNASGGGPHTLVTLEHRGWERLADPEGSRADYAGGWVAVIGRYGALAADDRNTWLVLSHAAGPAAPTDGSVFGHPDFAEHLAFLGRLAERGVLVAAGPLAPLGTSPTGASGMTVIRVRADEVSSYADLARTDDRSVVRGLLTVETTTWAVALT